MTNAERDRRKNEIAIAAAILLLDRRHQRSLRATATAALAIGYTDETKGASLENAIRVGVRRLRASTRVESRKHWIGLTKQSKAFAHPTPEMIDERSAQRAATGIRDAWTAQLQAAGSRSPYRVSAWREAEDAIGPNLDRTATTETVFAWNDEVELLNTAAVAAGLVVTERWESLLDACPSCKAMEIESPVVRPNRFSIYPPVHPRCRCFISTSIEERIRVAA